MDITVDIGKPPESRWSLPLAHRQFAQALIEQYYAEMDGSETLAELITEAAQPHLTSDHWK